MSNPAFVPAGWGAVKPKFDLDLPSGARVKVEHLEITELLQLGIIDSIDSFSKKLLPAVQDAASSGKSQEEIVGENVVKDIDQFGDVLKVVDKVVARAIVEPKVHVAPKSKKGKNPELDPDKFYAHLIPLEDRMAVFEAVLPDMSDTFQPGGGSSAGVENVENGEGVSGSPE